MFSSWNLQSGQHRAKNIVKLLQIGTHARVFAEHGKDLINQQQVSGRVLCLTCSNRECQPSGLNIPPAYYDSVLIVACLYLFVGGPYTYVAIGYIM